MLINYKGKYSNYTLENTTLKKVNKVNITSLRRHVIWCTEDTKSFLWYVCQNAKSESNREKIPDTLKWKNSYKMISLYT